MIKRTYEELEPYFPAGHFGVTCKRYHGKDETGAQKFWIGVSEFEPDGGADWAYDDNPLEKVYFVLEGEMTVTDKDGNKYVIHKNESISFPPNEGRGLKNESGKPAKMLVIINYPWCDLFCSQPDPDSERHQRRPELQGHPEDDRCRCDH